MDPQRNNAMENQNQQQGWYPPQMAYMPNLTQYYPAPQQVATFAFYPVPLSSQMCPLPSLPQELMVRPSAGQPGLPPLSPLSAARFQQQQMIPAMRPTMQVPVSAPAQIPSPAPPSPSPEPSIKKSDNKQSHKRDHGVYKCTKCERTYLSYPALYTHMKIKHPQPKSANPAAKTTNRGRPKKNVIPLSDSS